MIAMPIQAMATIKPDLLSNLNTRKNIVIAAENTKAIVIKALEYFIGDSIFYLKWLISAQQLYRQC
jgi:hypothetical protein